MKEQSIADRNVGLQKFDDIFQESQINEGDLKKLGDSLGTIASTTATISDITQSSLATKDYFDKMGNAAQNMDNVASAYSENTSELNESVGTLAGAYKQTAEMIQQKG